MPIDFRQHPWLSVNAGNPEAWQDLTTLLRQHGVEWGDEDLERVRGLNLEGAAGAEQAYFYFGLIGAWIGFSITFLGTVALGGRAV
jgi:hypothetical protein